MPRPIWKGAISFGLVNVPVNLIVAESHSSLRFRQLDEATLRPVREQRFNEATGEIVEWQNIVKGYEYAPDRFVVISDDELAAVDPKASHTIDIQAFVAADEIDPRYYERPYYLSPGPGGEKGYALLRAALVESRRLAVAKIVLRTKQYLAAIMPVGPVLVLELLRYEHELRDAAALIEPPSEDLESLGIGAREVDMATQLLAAMVEPWRPEQYRDTYRDEVLELIERKVAAGGEAAPAAPQAVEETTGGEIVDIMELLRQSVERQRDDESAAGSK